MRRILERARRSRLFDLMLFSGLVFGLLVLVAMLPEDMPLQASGPARVIDGDSLAVGGVEIRLTGIDAPELDQTCKRDGKEWTCGTEAAAQLRRLIGGVPLQCAGRRTDKHRRLLAVCRKGEVEINRLMVEEGWAVSYSDYPSAERRARTAKRGIWAGTFERPHLWREKRKL